MCRTHVRPPCASHWRFPPDAVWVCWDTTSIKHHKRLAAASFSRVKPYSECPVHEFIWPPMIFLIRWMMCMQLFICA